MITYCSNKVQRNKKQILNFHGLVSSTASGDHDLSWVVGGSLPGFESQSVPLGQLSSGVLEGNLSPAR